ncbi:hypothetical protein B0J18DRAFT_493208 [Chaetomium sp. MPI-SDFR-AT-0129]|nr:hypothetical protein B0J18DRAFT_493208 [Chaetomium sp. MPI-SDFR-AT-0129]
MIEPKTIGLGVLLAASAGGISWMWASDSTQAQAKIELAKDELCQLHERLVKLHPMAEPPTLFEFLDLDAYGPHFHPPEVSLHPESKGYEEAKRFIVQKASEKASLWYEEQNLMWGMESERVN